MTAYFGFAPSEALKNDIETLFANLAKKAPEPQYHLLNTISIKLTDEIIDNLLLNLVDMMQKSGEGEGGGLLKLLGGFLKKTMHGLLKMMLGKADNAEVNKRAEYLRSRFLQLPNDKVRIGFKLDQTVYNQFAAAFKEVDAGNGKAITQQLIGTMKTFSDAALVAFFDDFIAVLDLGMINRKGASVARGLIHKESHSTIEKLIPSLKDNQLKEFSAYFQAMLVER
ncbi:hypothetical protein [Agitococcus lubricus]|uniref:Uncharacterized protein n=1 Tax=Agitococcus lubricus TaxID=1077255 RepID=A0A2T5IZ10_9GAMM|nr:hypothetical protein [Agitococcus lubricus]PTQ89252.1 hypothetical protein C8N29_108136 [Agitococcus lubricus]